MLSPTCSVSGSEDVFTQKSGPSFSKQAMGPPKKVKLDSMIDVCEAAHEKSGSDSEDVYSYDSQKEVQEMEKEILQKQMLVTPKNLIDQSRGGRTFKHFDRYTIQIDQDDTNDSTDGQLKGGHHKTQVNSPRVYTKNPDFGFKNELIHELRRDNSEPKYWGLMYQMISGQENNKRFERLIKEMGDYKTHQMMSEVATANKLAQLKHQSVAFAGSTRQRRAGLIALPNIRPDNEFCTALDTN